MLKRSLYFFFLIFLSNCTMSGTAFLGPAFTGVKTGSVYQTSLSYGSNKIINHIKFKEKIRNTEIKKTLRKITAIPRKIYFVEKDPFILTAYKVDKVEFSEVSVPEPLP